MKIAETFCYVHWFKNIFPDYSVSFVTAVSAENIAKRVEAKINKCFAIDIDWKELGIKSDIVKL